MDFIWDFVDPGLFVSHLINFLILFFIFKYFLGDHIVNLIKERRKLEHRLAHADEDYQELIAQAEKEKETLLQEALRHKNNIVQEAEATAQKKAERIIELGQNEATHLKHEAAEKAKLFERELSENFKTGVKQTSRLVVEKLFEKDQTLREAYLDELVEEFIK